MFEKKNYHNVFVRNVIVGVSSFLYDIMEIEETINDEDRMKKVPIFYSMSGSEQFLTDYFLNTDKYHGQLSCKIEGNVNTIPSGVFTIKTGGISTQDTTSPSRMVYDKEIETELTNEVRKYSAETEILVETFTLEFTIKASSDIEKWKIYDAIVENLYKVKKFYIRYKGFNKLPCLIGFPENYDVQKQIQFRFNDNDKRPQVVFSAELKTTRPIIDKRTETETNIDSTSLGLTYKE